MGGICLKAVEVSDENRTTSWLIQEIQHCLSEIRKCLSIRDVGLKVNAQYIASAAMSDDYRIEPLFKLQGSYRNMNKLIVEGLEGIKKVLSKGRE